MQTDFTPGSGNALQACAASIFHASLDETPNFITAPEGYERALTAWLHAKGRRLHKVQLHDGCLPDHESGALGALGILRGTSPRGDHGHVVVARVGDHGALT